MKLFVSKFLSCANSREVSLKDNILHSNTSFMAFGSYLKSMRTQMGIPIEAVAGEIRISIRQLSLIEAEEHEKLPDVVYVKGILRAYAGYIGVDADDIVERYLINRSAYEKKSSETKFFNYNSKKFYRLCVWAGVLITVIVLAGYAVYGFRPKMMHQIEENAVQAIDTKASSAVTESPDVSFSASGNDKLFLQIDAVEDTDLKIIIDDSEPLKYSLHPMDHMELEASSTFNILVDNAAGVKILLNGEPVAVSGKSGEFVNITLPQSK